MPAPMREYPYTLDEPLLWLTPKNPWTIGMACEGTAIFGDMGSGKTSGSGKTIAQSMLNAGFGGLVLCKKTDECDTWIKYATDCKRQDQLLIVHPRQPWRFNFLEYTFRRPGEGGFVLNAVSLFMNIIQNRRELSGQSEDQQRFFTDGVRRLLRNSMEALLLAGKPVTMDALAHVMSTVPYAHPQTGERVWPCTTDGKPTFLAETLHSALLQKHHGLLASTIDPASIKGYFENEFAKPGADRQSAGILSTYTGMAEPFSSGPVKELFCTTTTFLPEFSRRGAIIIVNLPTDEYEEVGRTAQLTFKYVWQKAIQRRQGLPRGEVPVFLWQDEAQDSITDADKAFQQASRSSVACSVFLSQNINNYLAAFNRNAEAMAYALLAGLGTKIFHRNGDFKTNEFAAQTIAKDLVTRTSGSEAESRGVSESHTRGGNWGSSGGPQGGSSSSGGSWSDTDGTSRQRTGTQGWNQQIDYDVQPQVFTRLKSGGKKHRYEVEAIIFKSGESFSTTGKPYTPVTFSQRG